MRFAMFAERAVGVLADAKQIEALPSNEKGLDADVLMRRVAAKSAAKADIETFTPMLYPPDETVN